MRSFIDVWQTEKGRQYPPKVNRLRGADWQDLACIQGLRRSCLGHLWKPPMCRDFRLLCAGGKDFQTRNTFGPDSLYLRTKGFQPSCAQNRLAQNQNCIRLGLGRFSEVPFK